MSILIDAQKFLADVKDKDHREFYGLFKALSEKLQSAVATLQYGMHRIDMNKYFIPENRSDKQTEELSPDGKYKLVIANYSTKENCWSYSRGEVFLVGSDTPLFVVDRNYSSFPFGWIMDHNNGHQYLICGEDYQGQTVLELDTGKRRDYISKEIALGNAFCFAEIASFDKSTSTLIIDGCHWACPYEYRLYDFSDPLISLTHIKSEDYIDANGKLPTFETDGTIKTYDVSYSDDDDSESKEKPVVAHKIWKIENNKLVLVSEWVSEDEQARRIKSKEAEARYEKEIADFKDSDPLYLEYLKLLEDPAFESQEKYQSVGVTHDTWGKDHLGVVHWAGEERRWCKRIITHKYKEPGYTIDLSWATKTGPIKVEVYKDGNKAEVNFFEHSVEGMRQAFEHAKESIKIGL